MRTCPRCQRQAGHLVDLCDCGYEFPPESTAPQSAQPSYAGAALVLGCVAIVVGIIMTIWFAFGYETTVEVTAPGE